MPTPALRRLVAFVGHAPGLWFCYRERLPKALARDDVIAILATAASIGAAAKYPRARMSTATAVGLAWLTCHVLWGAYLAMRLPPAASLDPDAKQ